MLGAALYEAGETDAAEAQYRRLLEQQPGSGTARVALAEALLSQSRWDEAAAAAAAIGDDDPHAAAARRSELFARIVGGDLDGAAAVLARAERVASTTTQVRSRVAGERPRAVRRLDRVAARGEAERSPLPLGAVAAAGGHARGAAAGRGGRRPSACSCRLLDRCPISPRERRELLAGMYLRRGLPRLRGGGVARRLRRSIRATCARSSGSRRCAAAQGMTEDALDFAREAHALDPRDERATRLLAALEPLAA